MTMARIEVTYEAESETATTVWETYTMKYPTWSRTFLEEQVERIAQRGFWLDTLPADSDWLAESVQAQFVPACRIWRLVILIPASAP